MSVDAEKLKAINGGEIEEYWFPDGDASTRLKAYVDDGVARAASLPEDDQDAAVTAWAFFRAYQAIVLNRSASPSDVKLDSGKTAYRFTPEQIADIKERRDYWQAIAYGLMPADESATAAMPTMFTLGCGQRGA
jgi:hypothetical protein